MQTVIFLSGDLIFSTKVRAACQRIGWGFKLARTLPAKTSAGAENQEANTGPEVTMIILDLATLSQLTAGLVPAAREEYPQAWLVAYGPHVQKGHLEAAKLAGFDRVLTRGQFDHALDDLSQIGRPASG